MTKNRMNARIIPNLQEKRYYTLNLIESAIISGSKVQIREVDKSKWTYLNEDNVEVYKPLTDLSSEIFYYKKDPDNQNKDLVINTYIIFDERPKVHLLKSLGWFKEDGVAPILAYIPTHLIYNKDNEEVNNYEVFSGVNFKQLIIEGETPDHKLKPLEIIRGTLIDIDYDFLPKLANGEADPLGTTTRFFVADVKVDTVSLNYIANLMPYRFPLERTGILDETTNEIKDKDGNILDSNQSYIKFDSSKHGM